MMMVVMVSVLTATTMMALSLPPMSRWLLAAR
jgi:hypothetical protein